MMLMLQLRPPTTLVLLLLEAENTNIAFFGAASLVYGDISSIRRQGA